MFSAVDEEIWKRHRTLLNVAFTDKTYRYVCECTVDEMKQFDVAIKKNNKRDAGDCMTAITMDVIGKTAFGYNFNNVAKIDNVSQHVTCSYTFFSLIPLSRTRSNSFLNLLALLVCLNCCNGCLLETLAK